MLKVSNLSKTLGSNLILQDVSFSISLRGEGENNNGQMVAILAPSGSGKTTLLRCLSRLEKPDQGEITFQGKPLENLANSAIGLVFQEFHLFPHMTVEKNLTLAPLTLQKGPPAGIREQAFALLEKFGLKDKAACYPHQLSGGQKQRVAMARMLMLEPSLLLFDEPTSALDPETVGEVAQLISELKAPDRLIVVATHELRFAQFAADQVLFLDQGKLLEQTPAKVFFEKPQSPRAQVFVESFFGKKC